MYCSTISNRIFSSAHIFYSYSSSSVFVLHQLCQQLQLPCSRRFRLPPLLLSHQRLPAPHLSPRSALRLSHRSAPPKCPSWSPAPLPGRCHAPPGLLSGPPHLSQGSRHLRLWSLKFPKPPQRLKSPLQASRSTITMVLRHKDKWSQSVWPL